MVVMSMPIFKNKINNEKGATLLEVLASLIIASLVIATVTYVIQYTLLNHRSATERQNAQADALFVTDAIVKAVRERSDQTLITDNDTNCNLKVQSNNLTYTCFSFNESTQTLQMSKVEHDAVSLNVVLSTQLHAFEVEIDPTATKLDISLHYKLMKNAMYTHETSVYVPKL